MPPKSKPRIVIIGCGFGGLIGFRNRLVVLIDWASAYWSEQRYARGVTGIDPRATDN